MAAGSLRKRIRFERKARVADGMGGFTTSWPELVTVWGSVRPERGRERIDQGRLGEVLAAVIRVRSSTDTRALTPDDRAVVGGEVYNVRSISNPDQRNKYLELTAERGNVGT